MSTEDPRDPDLAALAAALLQAYTAQSVDDYLARGRSLAALGDQALQERYKRAYKAWAADPQNLGKICDAADVSAEFTLRNQYSSWASIRKELEVLNAAAVSAFRRIREDPALWEQEMAPIAKMLLDPKAKH